LKCRKFAGLDEHGDQICANGELCYHCSPDGELCDDLCVDAEPDSEDMEA